MKFRDSRMRDSGRNPGMSITQNARTSIGPDTLLDASEANREQCGTSDRDRVRLTTGYRAHMHRAQFASAVQPICGSRAEVRAMARTQRVTAHVLRAPCPHALEQV